MIKRFAQSADFATREEGEEKYINGYFAVFNSRYEIAPQLSESIDSNAFAGTLNDDIRALINHDTGKVLGRTTAGTLSLSTDEHGLWGEVKINSDDQDALNLYARVKRGDVNQCSFGFDILDEEKEVNEVTGDIHWKIKKVKLYEVSAVTFPAYKDTEISARKNEAEDIKKKIREAWKEKQKMKLKGDINA